MSTPGHVCPKSHLDASGLPFCLAHRQADSITAYRYFKIMSAEYSQEDVFRLAGDAARNMGPLEYRDVALDSQSQEVIDKAAQSAGLS